MHERDAWIRRNPYELVKGLRDSAGSTVQSRPLDFQAILKNAFPTIEDEILENAAQMFRWELLCEK